MNKRRGSGESDLVVNQVSAAGARASEWCHGFLEEWMPQFSRDLIGNQQRREHSYHLNCASHPQSQVM